MPTITHENVDELNAIVTLELAKDDYLPKVNKKLKEYRQKAQIKGFRPGKVPMNMIKRQFGTALLVEEVNTAVEENLTKYFADEKLRVLGQPMAVENKDLKLSIHRPEDYTFQFELGLAPEFEVAGVSTDTVLPFYDITIDEDMLKNEIDSIRKRYGQGFEEGVTDIQEDDMLSISLHELDESGNIKEDGLVKEETFLALRDVADEDLRNNLLSATVSDSFDINIYTIENKDEAHIRKHVLGLEEGETVNDQFRLTIKEIKRVEKAELNEAFFKQLFPNDEVTTAEEFEARVKEEIGKSYKQSSLNHYKDLVFDYLMEANEIELPIDFLKKWLRSSQENITDAFFEGEEFDAFLKNTRWSLIRDLLAEKYQVDVNYQDVENMTRGEIMRYFNNQIPAYGEMMDGMLQRVLSDRKEVNRRFEMLMDSRTLEHAAENMGKDMKPIDKEGFEELVKAYQESKQPAAPVEETATEEEVAE